MHSFINDISTEPVLTTRSRKKTTAPAVEYAVGESDMGHVLVAHSSVGICAILIGSNANQLKQDLAIRFPHSELIQNEPRLGGQMAKVAQFIKAPRRELDLKLDMQGTPFQQTVWNALRRVPLGTTVTYSELARRIGRPTCARAVASACASNPIALAVPCHRAVRSDGLLSGYRWGIERKREMIEKEAMA